MVHMVLELTLEHKGGGAKLTGKWFALDMNLQQKS
jgi:hypothetical protein